MKKRENGKTYDTETGMKMATWANERPPDSELFVTETLYKTIRGQYFLHYEGGPGTQFSKRRKDGVWCAGGFIGGVSEDEAKEWVQSKLGEEKFAELFPVIPEEKRDRIALTLANVSIRELRRASRKTGLSVSRIVDGLTLHYLDEFIQIRERKEKGRA